MERKRNTGPLARHSAPSRITPLRSIRATRPPLCPLCQSARANIFRFVPEARPPRSVAATGTSSCQTWSEWPP